MFPLPCVRSCIGEVRKSALLLGQLGPEHCQLSYFVPSWVPSRGSGFTEACHWHQPPQQHFWQKSNLVSANSCNAPGLCGRWGPSGLLTVATLPLLRNTERSANSCNATNYRLSALSLCPASNLSPVTSMSTFSTDPTDFGVDPHCRAALFLFDTNTTKNIYKHLEVRNLPGKLSSKDFFRIIICNLKVSGCPKLPDFDKVS